jgi:hypothetical protein
VGLRASLDAVIKKCLESNPGSSVARLVVILVLHLTITSKSELLRLGKCKAIVIRPASCFFLNLVNDS